MNHKITAFLLISSCIIGLVALVPARPGYAQTPTATPAASQPPTPSVDLSAPDLSGDPGVSPAAAQGPQVGRDNVIALSLAQLGYDDVALEGPVGRAKFNLELPSYWQKLAGSVLTLHYDLGLLASEPVEPLELQVSLNDVLVYWDIITSADEQYLTIPLPAAWPARNLQRDELEILVRSQGVCDTETLVNSLRIFSDSFVRLNYRVIPPRLNLAGFPAPIFERTFEPQSAYMVLPTQPTRPQLEGALSVAARLGNLSNNNLAITTTLSSALEQTELRNQHLILVGAPQDNSLFSVLADNAQLPAPYRPRRLEFSGVGPAQAIAGEPLTYTLRVTNTETVTASILGVNVQLPGVVQDVSCQPYCFFFNNMRRWNLSSLAPGETAAVTLTFRYPLTTGVEPASLTFELLQNQEIINIDTLPSPTETTAPTLNPGPYFFVANGRAVPETDGVIQLLPSPWRIDKAILLVTGLNDEAVHKAGRALGTTANLLGMNGQVALVEAVQQADYLPPPLPDSFSLAEIGYEDRAVVGATSQDIWYPFDLPSNWALSPEAEVRFNFSHSSLLDPAQSSITLLFNNMPLASAPLDDSNIITGELRALLPPERARPGRMNNLIARVDMRLADPCAEIDSEQAWVNFKASSTLHLPHTVGKTSTQFDLDLLPVPFVTDPNLGDIVIALPPQPTLYELDAAMRLAAYLGAENSGFSFQPAAWFGLPDAVDMAQAHLVAIGRPSRNPLLQEVNGLLPQPFIPGTDNIQPLVDRVVFRLPDNLDLGYVQVIPSTWSQNHALLALTGTSDLGVNWAVDAVTQPAQNEQLAGDLALIRDGREIHTIDTRQLYTGGELAVIATAIPQTEIVGTVTPTPRPPTPTPAPPPAQSAVGPPAATGSTPELPFWFPYVIGGGIALIVLILGIAYWQSHRQTRLRPY